MAIAKYRDPATGQYVPILGESGNAFIGAQIAASAPTPRGVGDLWVDTSVSALEWDTDWKTASLINGWVAYPAPYVTPQYRKLPGGLVLLRGLMRSGTVNAGAFILPVGYRPNNQLIFPSISNNGAAEIVCSCNISTGGVFTPRTGAGNAWFTVDGISFYADA